jgi:hypothetical protein
VSPDLTLLFNVFTKIKDIAMSSLLQRKPMISES